jgi:hypothetical protein
LDPRLVSSSVNVNDLEAAVDRVLDKLMQDLWQPAIWLGFDKASDRSSASSE